MGLLLYFPKNDYIYWAVEQFNKKKTEKYVTGRWLLICLKSTFLYYIYYSDAQLFSLTIYI